MEQYPTPTRILFLEIEKTEKEEKISVLTGTNKVFEIDILPGIIKIKERQPKDSVLYRQCTQQMETISKEINDRESEIKSLILGIAEIEIKIKELESA